MGDQEKLFTASDLAGMCQVDLKTIHNWVDKGRIVHFRTPGRHLRFRRVDVVDFLRAWGYPIPKDLNGDCSVLYIPEREDALLSGADFDSKVRIITQPDPLLALFQIGLVLPDALVLGVHMSDADGLAIIQSLAKDAASKRVRCVVYANDVDEPACRKAGAYDVIPLGDKRRLADSIFRMMGIEQSRAAA